MLKFQLFFKLVYLVIDLKDRTKMIINLNTPLVKTALSINIYTFK